MQSEESKSTRQFVFFSDKNPMPKETQYGRKVRLTSAKQYQNDGFYPAGAILIITRRLFTGPHKDWLATEESDLPDKNWEIALGETGWLFEDDYQANLANVNTFVATPHEELPSKDIGRAVRLLENKHSSYGFYPSGSILIISNIYHHAYATFTYIAKGFGLDETVGLGESGWEFVNE